MNIVDIVLLGSVFLTFLIGLWRGFIREFSSIMAWVLAGVATFWDVPILREFMREQISSGLIADFATGCCVFLIAFIIISLTGTICAGFVRGTSVSSIDRSLGALLGSFKGIVVICSLNIVAECFLERSEMPEIIQKSFIANFYLYQGSDILYSVLPQKVKEYLEELRRNNLSLQKVEGEERNIISQDDRQDDRKNDRINALNDLNDQKSQQRAQEEQERALIELGTLRPKISHKESQDYTQKQFDELSEFLEKNHD